MSWYQSDLQQSESAYVPPTWADGTDEEIVTALEKHYAGEIDLTEYWTVGDERTVTLSAMSVTGVGESHAAQNVTLVLTEVGGKYLSDEVTECAFQVDQKHCLNETGYMNSTNTNAGGWRNSARRTWCNSVYKNAFPATLQPIFKEFINQSARGGGYTSGILNTTDTFALRAEIEIFGSTSYSVSGEGTQVEYYKTAANRIKQTAGSNLDWWERSPQSGATNLFCSVNSVGDAGHYYPSNNIGVAPFGVI